MENKGKQKNNPRDDMSLDQAILQWIVDDYDIPDEKSRKIVGESGKKSKLITCKMVMDYLDNRGVVEETDETEFMYEVDDRDKTADLSTLHGLLDKRQELSDQIEQMEQEKTAIEQQVKLQMQDAAYGTAPGYKVSWVSSESKRVDSQRLRKEQPDIFNQYSKNVSSRRFTIVHAA